MRWVEGLIFERRERTKKEYVWRGARMFNTHFDDEHFEMMGAELEDDCSDELVVERKLRGTGVVAVGLAIMGAMILKKRRG